MPALTPGTAVSVGKAPDQDWNIFMFRMRRFSTGPLAPAQARTIIEEFLNSGKPDTVSLRKALVACTTLEAAYKASARPDYHEVSGQHDVKEAEALLDQVLQRYRADPAGGAAITNQTLLEYFTAEHPPSTASGLKVLSEYAAKSPANVIPEQISMIPFRRAVYEADFRGALDVMESTCGEKSNFKTLVNRKLTKIGGIWSVGVGSAMVGVHSLLASGVAGDWDSTTSVMISVMFGTYLTALSLYGTMAASGSKSGLGSVLEWVPGTSPLYRYRHSAQLKMATFVTELNRSLPENLGECSPQLLTDLQAINLKPVETQEEGNLKEYWARGGAGFEWVEPDQDPAYLLWYKHMESTRQQRIASPYSRKDSEGKLLSWMSEVEREKQGLSIPHASLLDVEDLKSEQSMKTFEQELAEDMKKIRGNDHKSIGPESEKPDEPKDGSKA